LRSGILDENCRLGERSGTEADVMPYSIPPGLRGMRATAFPAGGVGSRRGVDSLSAHANPLTPTHRTTLPPAEMLGTRPPTGPGRASNLLPSGTRPPTAPHAPEAARTASRSDAHRARPPACPETVDSCSRSPQVATAGAAALRLPQSPVKLQIPRRQSPVLPLAEIPEPPAAHDALGIFYDLPHFS
jgi:hypothetical protein